MFSKIKQSFVFPKSTNDAGSRKISIDKMIDRLMQYIGFFSYSTFFQVHWTANFSTFCFLITCVLQIIALFLGKDDPQRLFECCSIFSFCCVGVLKLRSLRKYHGAWRYLLIQISIMEHEQLNDNPPSIEYESDNEHNNEEFSFTHHISVYTNNFKNTLKILTRIYAMTAIIFILSPFAELILCKLLGMECLAFPHVLPGWAPLDDISFFGYVASVVCEVIAAAYCVTVHIVFDVMAIGIMMFVCGQFCLLRDYSSRIAGKGKMCNISHRRDMRAHYRIMKCHHINTTLIRLIIGLDKLLREILGVYFFVATITLCTVAVRLNSEDMSTMQLLTLIQYMCGTLTQLFLFCRYGDAVMNESSICMGEGPFGAALWCITPRIRREIMMLGASMMRPRRLHAGPFNSLNLPSFIQVVRAAYSYYAVLGKRE